jgi:hypothetical protein
MPEMNAPDIQLIFYSSDATGGTGPPVFPGLGPGRTYVLPLIADGNRWKLLEDEGWGLVAPAIEAEPPGKAPASKREFIIRELSSILLRGSYPDLHVFGVYLRFRPASDMNDEIMASLTAELPPGDRRWLDISTALLACVGVPRRKLDDLISGGGPRSLFPNAPELLAARALRQVPESRRREGVIRNMLQFSAIHGWGSAATLVPEFKDDPLLLELLPGYLKRPQKGAVYIACWLVNSGQLALLEPTLEAALRCLTEENSDYSELNTAGKLLLDRGSDRQFEQYLKILRDAKVHDIVRYQGLWQVAWFEKSQRAVRILAVPLDDERPASKSDPLRFCDYAAAILQGISKQDFGVERAHEMSLAERDAAVKRARAWMSETLPKAM